jgi:hypothetical protein
LVINQIWIINCWSTFYIYGYTQSQIYIFLNSYSFCFSFLTIETLQNHLIFIFLFWVSFFIRFPHEVKRLLHPLWELRMVSFHPHKEWLWNIHPSNERLWNHWANENLGWYVVLTSRLLMKQRLRVLGCNSWSTSQSKHQDSHMG